MGKRVKSVSMPGLAAKLSEIDGRGSKWTVRRVVTYSRSTATNAVDILAERNVMSGAGWTGLVATAELDDDGLLKGYRVSSDTPYAIGRILDTAWESLT